MVSRKSMILGGTVAGVMAIAAVMTVNAQDGQSSRRTRPSTPPPANSQTDTAPRTATNIPPATNTAPHTAGSPTPVTPPGTRSQGEPTPAVDPFARYQGSSSAGEAASKQDAAQTDPFFTSRRGGTAAEPRPFGGDSGSQLPAHNTPNQIPGSLHPEEGTNALRPVPQPENSLRSGDAAGQGSGAYDPFAGSRAPATAQGQPEAQSGQGTDPFGQLSTQPAPATLQPQQDRTADAGGSALDGSPFDRYASRTAPRVSLGEPVTGSATLFRQQAPSLVVETKGPEEVIVGRPAVIRVQVFNEAELAAKDVRLSLQLPADVEITTTEPSGGRVQNRGVTAGMEWTIDSINPGGGESLSLTVIPKSSQPLDVRMQWTTAAADAVARMKVLEPKLLLTVAGPKEVNFGEKAVYTMTFSNPGTADAENVEILLMPLEPGEEPESHEIGTIAAGDKRDVEIELVPKQTGLLKIRAEATALGGLTSQVSEDVLVRRAGIDVELQGPNFRYAKTPATYRLHVTNPGNAVATGVQVGAMLPPGATFVSATNEGQSEEGGRIRWRIAQLAPGAEMDLEFRVELSQDGRNRVEAVAIADGELRANHEFATDVEALAELNLNVRDPQGPVPVGEDAEYEIVITNRGTKAAERIEIVAYFSEGVEPVEVTGATNEIRPGMVLLGPLPVLAADDQTIIKIKAKADMPGNHQFRVELRCAALDTELAEQKMTRFYGESRGGLPARNSASPQTKSDSPQQDRYGQGAGYGAGGQGAGYGAGGQGVSDSGVGGQGTEPTPVQDSRYEASPNSGAGATPPPADRYADRYQNPATLGSGAAGSTSGSATGSGEPTPAIEPVPAGQQSSRRQPTPANGQ